MSEEKTEKVTTFDFDFQIKDGEIMDWCKPLFREHLSKLENGRYNNKGKLKKSERFTATRWKYLYDCVYKLALPTAKIYLKILDNGKIRPVENEDDVHTCMLGMFNSATIVDAANNRQYSASMSSKKLTDDKFWFPFVEGILLYFSEQPHFLEIPHKDEWKSIRKKGRVNWETFMEEWHESTGNQIG